MSGVADLPRSSGEHPEEGDHALLQGHCAGPEGQGCRKVRGGGKAGGGGRIGGEDSEAGRQREMGGLPQNSHIQVWSVVLPQWRGQPGHAAAHRTRTSVYTSVEV